MTDPRSSATVEAAAPESVQAEPDRLTIQLPPGASEIVITRDAFDTAMDAAARLWVLNLPDTPLMGTVHVAMKTAARAMLWYMGKAPLPGMPEPPRLTRQDDAVIVVIRFMLSWLFGTALRAHGGKHDVTTAAGDLAALGADAASAADAGALKGWHEFTTAVAGLVAGPRDGSAR